MTKINATKDEFARLYNGLVEVKDLKSKKFALVTSKNMAIIRDALQHVEDLNRPTKEFIEIAQKINAIANKNEEGAEEQIKNIEEANAEIIQTRKDQVEKVSEILKEELELELTLITEDVLPEDITADQITNILKIIK
jgi:ribosomal protein L16 Arg81 hydroxylase|tara:strand:+ start:63 stop:476 length:414 start_codon:yes stop_codon:yes gene_type:complete